MSKQPAILQT